jgi:biopolymer transport protein TolR
VHPDQTPRVAPVPNVTPMIDVMLVLLCIFMIVTPALTNGVVATPPEAEQLSDRPEAPEDHTLALDVNGVMYIDRVRVAESELGEVLRRTYPPSATDRVLYVRAHRELEFRHVRNALDVARESGVAVVGLVSEQKRR